MKMVALRDYLDPYENKIHNVNSGAFEHPDEPLCDFLVQMGTLDYAPTGPAPEPEPAPAPAKTK